MPAKVTFASARPKQLKADATLPALLDRMLVKWAFKKRFGGKKVAIKMHLGGHMGYSTIHPLLVGRIVKAVKDAGGKPFICDVPWAVNSAWERGYTQEVLGAPHAGWTGVRWRWSWSAVLRGRTAVTATRPQLAEVTLAGGQRALFCWPPEAAALLASVPALDNKIVTADALHCQRPTARTIVEKGGEYCLQIKANQPALLAHARALDAVPGTPFLSRPTKVTAASSNAPYTPSPSRPSP